MPTRREFNGALVNAAVSCSLLRVALEARAFSGEIDPLLRNWQRGLHEMCRDVGRQSLAPLEWQQRIEALHRTISLEDLLRYIDFDRLIDGIDYPDDRGAVEDVRLPEFEGLPERRGFGSKIFAYKRGAATAPHAHNNMVSAHLVLQGSFHVRTYERVRDEPEHLIIEPSIDEQSNAGRTISMSDERDNVHWFLASSDHAYTFDVPVGGIYPAKDYATQANRYGMIYVEPDGERLAEGRIRAPILSFEQALARYGSSHVD